MSKAWLVVPLGEVVAHRKEFIRIDDLATYKRCRVQLHAQGIVLRDIVSGSEIKTKDQQVCRAGEFLVAEIDAKVGGFGIVPGSLDGAIVSSHYFLFTIDESVLERRYLDFFIRTPVFREQVLAQGSTNYAAIRPRDMLGYKIPLPPLSEQRRIVARIEELAAKIEEARGLRRQAVEEVDTLLTAMAHRADLDAGAKLDKGWSEVAVGDVIRQVEDSHSVQVEGIYPNFGIYSFGRGLFKKPPIQGLSTSAKTLYRVRAGQFIYSRLFAFEGAYGLVSKEFDGHFVSNEYPTFACNPDRVRAEFLYAYFKSPTVWSKVSAGSKGLGDRRQRVQPAQILAHRLMLPPLAWQERICAMLAKVEEVKHKQTETTAELDAMLPSVLDKAFKGEL